MKRTQGVLIVGGSGFIGTHLALKLRDEHKVYLTFNSRSIQIPGVTCLPLDLKRENWVKRVIYMIQPDVVIFAAGANDPAWSEVNPRDAERMHAGGPSDILNTSITWQPKFIYLSNGYTFDGLKGNYKETDTLLPANALGKAKVAGENFIRGKSLNYNLIRVSPLFGRGNGRRLSSLDVLRIKLERNERIEVPHTELHGFAPVSGLTDLVSRLIQVGPKKGIFHYGGLSRVSYYEFAKQFAKTFGYDSDLVVQKQLSQALPTNRYGEPLIADFSLNCTQTVRALEIKPLLLQESLDLFQQEMVGET